MTRSSRPRRARTSAYLAALAISAAVAVVPASGPAGAAGSALTGSASLVGAPPACPAAVGNARFVRFVYREILGRCPDAKGAAFWTAKLDTGTSRWQVADALDLSTENLGRNNVDELYSSILGRVPTAAERTRWIAHIRARREDGVPTATLVASDEAYAARTSAVTAAERDQEWLDYAYDRILDRAPDPSGAAHYTGSFSPAGSTSDQRFRVAMSLERSPSNARSWAKAAMAEALGRPGDPAGVAYWTAWLQGRGDWQTFRLWTLQLSSDEAFRRAQTQPA